KRGAEDPVNRLPERVGGRLREKGTRPPVDHGLESATAPVGDDRAPCRLRLDRRDAEVLLAGEQEGAGAAVELAELGVGDAAQEARVGRGQRLEPSALGAL